eukprot:c3736_g1_i1.p1 GENE.c3736_g1_i1~~c3736_g1_i1.p1  ORF type:complete len:328 (-),score=43.16 c3736_g1_i1:108-1091(-)
MGKFPEPMMRGRGHTKALQPHPAYPERSQVPLGKVLWDIPFPEYSPVNFTADVVHKFNRLVRPGGWADPDLDQMSAEELTNRISYCGPIFLDQRGAPRNPMGRTGMCGRGLLGKWGPNHAADPIVTRFNPDTGALEMVAIKRTDTLEWAIPGGMVDAGEQVSETLKREFGEEAMSNQGLSPEELEEWREQLNDLFHSGIEIFKGYVDDPRNTDNSWMETTAVWFHADESMGSKMKLSASDDALAVRWLPLDDTQAVNNLYASHADFVRTVIGRKKPHRSSVSVRSFAPHNDPGDVREIHEREHKWVMAFAAVVMVIALVIILVFIFI